MKIPNDIKDAYQTVAQLAIQDEDPAQAAARWKEMVELCDSALALVLDYKKAALTRYEENLADAEHLKTNPLPSGLFQQ